MGWLQDVHGHGSFSFSSATHTVDSSGGQDVLIFLFSHGKVTKG